MNNKLMEKIVKIMEAHADWLFAEVGPDHTEMDKEEALQAILALLTSEVEKERERLLGEIENEKEDEYTMGFEDGVEQNLKEYKKTLFLQLESKGTFVNAYANGPLLVDSIIIPMDDWLKIKRQRKALSELKGGDTK